MSAGTDPYLSSVHFVSRIGVGQIRSYVEYSDSWKVECGIIAVADKLYGICGQVSSLGQFRGIQYGEPALELGAVIDQDLLNALICNARSSDYRDFFNGLQNVEMIGLKHLCARAKAHDITASATVVEESKHGVRQPVLESLIAAIKGIDVL